MTEDEARAWIADRFGDDACDRVAVFLTRVADENARQNLISPGSIPTIWARHAVDSAQLLTLAGDDWSSWIDIGTGGGFPGMIVALLAPERRVTMVEPRRMRAEFLGDCLAEFGLAQARVAAAKIEAVMEKADVISARAVASVDKLVRAAGHCATERTMWLLPRGRSGAAETEASPSMFHVEHSLTDSDSIILLGRGVPR